METENEVAMPSAGDANAPRHGTFSSSQVHKLIKKGRSTPFSAAGDTYIKQVSYERRLGRAIGTETQTRPTSWGNVCEDYVYDKYFGLEYEFTNKTRFVHKDYPFFSGAPDLIQRKLSVVGDIKCPQLEKFCDRIMAHKQGIEVFKEAHPEDYWQLVSNAVLLDSNGIKTDYGLSVIFCPYQEEVADLVAFITDHLDPDLQRQASWMSWATADEMPYLIKGRQFDNINKFVFEIPQEDKELLLNRVIEANNLLNTTSSDLDKMFVEKLAQ